VRSLVPDKTGQLDKPLVFTRVGKPTGK